MSIGVKLSYMDYPVWYHQLLKDPLPADRIINWKQPDWAAARQDVSGPGVARFSA